MTWRKVHIDGSEWTYHIGQSVLVICSPKGERRRVGAGAVMGTTGDIVERGRYKQTSDGMITPSKIKSYIINHWVE